MALGLLLLVELMLFGWASTSISITLDSEGIQMVRRSMFVLYVLNMPLLVGLCAVLFGCVRLIGRLGFAMALAGTLVFAFHKQLPPMGHNGTVILSIVSILFFWCGLCLIGLAVSRITQPYVDRTTPL